MINYEDKMKKIDENRESCLACEQLKNCFIEIMRNELFIAFSCIREVYSNEINSFFNKNEIKTNYKIPFYEHSCRISMLSESHSSKDINSDNQKKGERLNHIEDLFKWINWNQFKKFFSLLKNKINDFKEHNKFFDFDNNLLILKFGSFTMNLNHSKKEPDIYFMDNCNFTHFIVERIESLFSDLKNILSLEKEKEKEPSQEHGKLNNESIAELTPYKKKENVVNDMKKVNSLDGDIKCSKSKDLKQKRHNNGNGIPYAKKKSKAFQFNSTQKKKSTSQAQFPSLRNFPHSSQSDHTSIKLLSFEKNIISKQRNENENKTKIKKFLRKNHPKLTQRKKSFDTGIATQDENKINTILVSNFYKDINPKSQTQFQNLQNELTEAFSINNNNENNENENKKNFQKVDNLTSKQFSLQVIQTENILLLNPEKYLKKDGEDKDKKDNDLHDIELDFQITCICLLKDNRIASSLVNGEIKIISLTSTEQKFITLNGHTNSITYISLLNENKLASSSLDKTIKIWDLKTNKCDYTFENGHQDFVNKVIPIPENNIASCSNDGQIIIWNLQNKEIMKVKAHNDWVNTIHFLKQSNQIVSVSSEEEKTLKVWSIKDIINSRNRNIRLFQIKEINGIFSCSNHSICEYQNEKLLIGGLNELFILEVKEWYLIKTIRIKGYISAFMVTKDETYIAYNDKMIGLLKDLQVIKLYESGQLNRVYCITDINEKYFATCCESKTIKFWLKPKNDEDYKPNPENNDEYS